METGRIAPIADTSFAIAVFNRRDRYHRACIALYQRYREILLPQSVVTEIAIGFDNLNAGQFLVELYDHLKYSVVPLEQQDIERTAELLKKYHDTRLDFVDANVIATAERLNIQTILTLDHRDFRIVKPQHTEYLTLLPDLAQ